jgi:hypothetical protein
MDGLILYNGNSNGDESGENDNDKNDFIAIYLSKGYVKFSFNAGDGVTTVK